MEKLVVKSTSIVHPRNTVNQTSERVKKINLTPWDLLRLRFDYPQRGLFFPKPDLNIDLIISKLKTSLSIALDHFYPFSGRLVKELGNDDTVSFYISCDGGSGVKFVHAEANTVAVNDLINSGCFDGSFGTYFFPATGIKNWQGVSNPLFMVQVTELQDGIFMAFGFNHAVADGKSMWKFVNAWSEICSNDSGSGSKKYSQTLRGWFLDRVEYPIHIQDPDTKPPSYEASTTSNMLQEIVFSVTKENVLRLKARANEEVGSSGEGKISSYQAALGHIWRSRVKNGGMSREEETRCRVPIDMRQRLNPKLKEGCFGSVIQTGVVTVRVGEMLDNSLGWLGLQINKMVRSQTDENAKEFAENWVKNVEIPAAVICTLLVTDCPRFNVHVNDFGWGKPIAARSGPPHSNGKLVIQGIEGGFEFQASFLPQIVAKLVMDAEFLEYVDIVS